MYLDVNVLLGTMLCLIFLRLRSQCGSHTEHDLLRGCWKDLHRGTRCFIYQIPDRFLCSMRNIYIVREKNDIAIRYNHQVMWYEVVYGGKTLHPMKCWEGIRSDSLLVFTIVIPCEAASRLQCHVHLCPASYRLKERHPSNILVGRSCRPACIIRKGKLQVYWCVECRLTAAIMAACEAKMDAVDRSFCTGSSFPLNPFHTCSLVGRLPCIMVIYGLTWTT